MSLSLPESTDHPSRWSAEDPWTEIKLAPGAYPSSPHPEHELETLGQRSLVAAVKERRRDYVRTKKIKVKVGTWNVASIGGTYKDLSSWFIKGLGVKGLHQNLSGLSVSDDSDYSSEEGVESVEHQENRSGRKQSTVPVGETAAISHDDEIGLYVLGLQEVIDIASFTEAIRPYYDPNPGKKWKHAVKKGLPRGYVKIAEQQLLGLLILIYAAPEVSDQITSVDCTSVGTGALGYMGNKGAVSVRLVLGGITRLLFVNCHLAAGADQSALSRRIWDTGRILSQTKFEPSVLDGDVNPAASEMIGDEDFAFWFGDLNFRLEDIPGEDVRRLLLLHTRNEYDVLNKSRRRIDSELGYIDAIASSDTSSLPDNENSEEVVDRSALNSSAEPALDPDNDPASLITTIKSLLQHDQLRHQQRLRKAFHEGWREGDIRFLPTYKYDIGSVGMFDSGEKKRSPSWCDRILYRTRQDRIKYYERIEQEKAARKRDEEMKARGLDKDNAEEEVLFDYDPATDGADDYDEYDEAEDVNEVQPITTEEETADNITLEDYISHQRVLSSDHKPLSAVFDLTYDAVIPELKAQVQQEVARMLDKNENETRPNLTVVVENPSEGPANTDRSAGATDMNSLEFDEVRYRVPITRSLTIANTGPIPATFAFIDRPVGDGQEKGPFPSWIDIQVHHESDPNPKEKDDLGASTRFALSPGDIATVDVTVLVNKEEFVYALNVGAAKIDDILVLRTLHGRDHFISVKGTWMASTFYRYLDELVQFPRGVRSQPSISADTIDKTRKGSLTGFHSAPKELFDLTEALPRLVERAIADWTMTKHDVVPPWDVEPCWPFRGHVWKSGEETVDTQLANIREALDTAMPLIDHFDEQLPPLARVELLADTLVLFLESLKDGIVPTTAWQSISDKVASMERLKLSIDQSSMQEVVMESLSMTPVHSVSLTFVNFMLTRLSNELSSYEADITQSPATPVSRRARSSTEASQTPSELSTASVDSTSTRTSFLPSLSRRGTGQPSATKSPIMLNSPQDKQTKHADAYSQFWANIIVRSEYDNLVRGKEKKALEARKKKVIAALLDASTM